MIGKCCVIKYMQEKGEDSVWLEAFLICILVESGFLDEDKCVPFCVV